MKFIQEYTVDKTGFTLHMLPTKKYKTNTLVLKMKAPLTKETLHIVHCFHMCYKAIQVNILQHPCFDLILMIYMEQDFMWM